uniref:Pro-adrenomedullin n=1 Tax=Salarias fasciatus TaxID=181472 RepID=A0A672HIH6_SALFA
MRLSVQTFLCCCVFATVLGPALGPLEKGSLLTPTWFLLTSSPSFSAVPHMRPKRSTPPKASGCIFITCVYHDLVHRLHDLSNKQDKDKVPEKKLGCNGYGRRRREEAPDWPFAPELCSSDRTEQRLSREEETVLCPQRIPEALQRAECDQQTHI